MKQNNDTKYGPIAGFLFVLALICIGYFFYTTNTFTMSKTERLIAEKIMTQKTEQ